MQDGVVHQEGAQHGNERALRHCVALHMIEEPADTTTRPHRAPCGLRCSITGGGHSRVLPSITGGGHSRVLPKATDGAPASHVRRTSLKGNTNALSRWKTAGNLAASNTARAGETGQSFGGSPCGARMGRRRSSAIEALQNTITAAMQENRNSRQNAPPTEIAALETTGKVRKEWITRKDAMTGRSAPPPPCLLAHLVLACARAIVRLLLNGLGCVRSDDARSGDGYS